MKLWTACLAALMSVVPAGAMRARAAEPAKAEPVEVKIAGTLIKFDMVRVPGGAVTVKVDDKEQTVQVKSFWIGKTEVTWDEYDVWREGLDLTSEQLLDAIGNTIPSRPYANPDYGFGHTGFAAICVTSHSADMYTKWLSAKTGQKYRLATEAEWELAARAGSNDEVPESELGEFAWFRANSENEAGDVVPHAVATKKANALGIHDMLGNVAEWVTGVDGQMVVKGGWYDSGAKLVNTRWRSPYRSAWQMLDPQNPKSRWWLSDGKYIGFRVVREE